MLLLTDCVVTQSRGVLCSFGEISFASTSLNATVLAYNYVVAIIKMYVYFMQLKLIK